jgi:hypothetical protein
MLKEQFDLGWPVYYSGYSDDGGHAFVCDGYNDEDLFHFNWGWGGSSDGWFVIDEIDFAGWAQAIFNYVPSDVYDYMPLQPENLSVTPSGDFDYTATFQWTNPTRDIHSNNLTGIDQVIVTRNGEVVYTQNDVAPGITMSYTDNYMPAMVKYGVQVVVHNAASKQSFAVDVLLGPTCTWIVEMSSSDNQGWHEGSPHSSMRLATKWQRLHSSRLVLQKISRCRLAISKSFGINQHKRLITLISKSRIRLVMSKWTSLAAPRILAKACSTLPTILVIVRTKKAMALLR